ncbi:phosphatidylinositol mannoside acyltransferase [Cellulomonas fimi]|uniref:Lipid A biosynthesis acyltransferase n=1 Tax=Cellulomonas fimi (strain ATCC 484 / DSM 20113 / JCM 1341 / CCUG 24087 / LMG 16345 / NBRC 15513 / NCIMB 8980 / NCTC 7547 / NRS-133) TaxID=590998 RepID=F4H0C2_CELFA|nr:phosphatidylinositol mannoside acyltransferase [Cellulomonas fimi]AEE46169.1 lipid A biosynthesis acyltransferase [Cellulomonas fimi ATCC 484]NNH07044.1 phosphatidylinositol mannoside acyltransferase [Cellulomonas fimi]VEH31910.1 Phosphatidylinositol mannoside acyltransferase [Cellulomonas fimi]
MKVDVARLYAIAWRVAGKVPGPLLRGAARLAADVTWLRHGEGVRRLEKNLGRVRPELDHRALRRLSRAGMRSYMRYFTEAFALVAVPREQVDHRVRAVHRERVQPYLDEGRPILLALAHVGNWDLAGAWATRHLAPVTTVAERLEPEELFQEFVAFRESIGLSIIPLSGGGDVFRDLVRAARAPAAGVVPLLADRDLTARGVEVDLFGHRARVAAGPAALAISTGAPLFPTLVRYERLRGARRRAAGTPWGVTIEFSPRVEVPADVPRSEQVRAVTQAWVDEVAAGIHRHPEDWHMLQRVFVDDLDPARYAATVQASGASS